MESCEQEVLARLKEEEPTATPATRRAVTREMCRLLDSGLLEEELEDQSIDINHLISRLEVRDGDDDPDLKTKWNSWVGQMAAFFEGDYDRYQV